jgi:hypothetical protein
MLRYFLTAGFVFVSAALVCSAQSSSASNQQSPPPAPPPSSTTPAAAKTADGKDQAVDKDAPKDKKKPKKVWTEDDISKVGGISVVGDSSASTPTPGRSSSQPNGGGSGDSAQGKQLDYYRDQLRQLQAQLDVTDKKIDDLRNFKADNSSASGGINPNHGYSMTPIPDQIKQLEDKKKQIQDKIDALTDEARKKGIEPASFVNLFDKRFAPL